MNSIFQWLTSIRYESEGVEKTLGDANAINAAMGNQSQTIQNADGAIGASIDKIVSKFGTFKKAVKSTNSKSCCSFKNSRFSFICSLMLIIFISL